MAEAERIRSIAPFVMVYDPRTEKLLSMCTDIAFDNGILSLYSLRSPKEYFAESTAAYVMKQVFSKRYAHVNPSERRERLTLQLARLLEARSGLQATNLTAEAERYLEERLHVGRDLRFDREARRPDGLRGRWVRDRF
jgi:hypothetical protein